MFSLAGTKLEMLATCMKKNKTFLQMEVQNYNVDFWKKNMFLGAENKVDKILTHKKPLWTFLSSD